MSKRPRQDSNPSGTTHTGKYPHLEESSDSPESQYKIRCTLPPHHSLDFTSYEDYEVHYQKAHVNRCIECKRNLPTEHFLNLHIAENHDPLNAAKRERGDKTYQCFVEGCEKVCMTWQKRRMHLVDAHMFPRNYDFFVVNDGLDNRNSMLRPESSYTTSQQGSNAPVPKQSQNHQGPHDPNEQNAAISQQRDTVMTEVADSMAALKVMPKSVTFGRKHGGGLARS